MHNADEPLDRDVRSALDALQYPLRALSVDAVIQEARSRTRQRRLRLAAAAVVMLSAIGVAALPGSPARRWLETVFRSSSSAQSREAPIAPRDSVQNNARREMRGLGTSIGNNAELSFSHPQESGAVTLRLVAEEELRIRSPEFTGGYALTVRGIAVQNPASNASYEVDVGERASEFRVTVAGRVVFRRLNGTVVLGPLPRNDGAYVLMLR